MMKMTSLKGQTLIKLMKFLSVIHAIWNMNGNQLKHNMTSLLVINAIARFIISVEIFKKLRLS